MSVYKGTTLLAGVATNTKYNANNLLDFKWTDYLLSDQSWLRADTFSWQDGTVYSDAYDHLVADYNGGTSQTETIGSYTITYVLATDGHKITTDETNVSNIYNESGVAWYYVLDTANQRFKLPRENPAREELIQVIRSKGNGISLGLTNGTNEYALGGGAYSNNYSLGTSSNSGQPVGTSSGQVLNLIQTTMGITTDSTKSGIISSMTDSTSVYKGKKYLYFYVGQFSQSATEQTAGLNAELFNGKVDLDGHNATFAHIVETYKNGTDWYRIWSDGFIEQGGYAPYTGSFNGWTKVTLLKQFSDNKYNISLTGVWTGNTSATPVICKNNPTYPTTTDGFYFASSSVDVYWEAKGY